MHALALAARSEDAVAWERYFGRVLILALDCLQEREPKALSEAALLCLQELVECHPRFFHDFAEVVASKLWDAFKGSADDRPAQAMIDRTIERLLGTIEPGRAIEILVPIIGAEAGELLEAALRILSGLLERTAPAEVLIHMNMLLPGVVAAFSNPNADVRKVSVACLVNIYLGLGEQAMPFFLRDLTPSQMKLVTLYIGRQAGTFVPGMPG